MYVINEQQRKNVKIEPHSNMICFSAVLAQKNYYAYSDKRSRISAWAGVKIFFKYMTCLYI